MTKQASLGSSIAQFAHHPDATTWPQRRMVEALVEQCVEALFQRCRADSRAWLSEADLECLLFAELSRGLGAAGLAQCAVHAEYPFRMPVAVLDKLGKRDATLPVDLVLAVPDSIHHLRGRHWGAQIVAAIEVKRGFERQREIRRDLDKLAAIHEVWPEITPYLVVVGYHNQQEDVAAIDRASQDAGVVLFAENYWGANLAADQLELDESADSASG